MYDFSYHRPASLDDAAGLFGKADDPVFMAGGMTLIPTLKQRLASPSDVIDLAGVGDDLSGIAVDGGTITVGAMTTHAEVAGSGLIQEAIPALAALAGRIGDAHVRNRGTIGGSLANNDPAADYPAAVLGLNATVRTARREIAADDYFKGMFETALKDDEIITAVSFPAPDCAAYMKFDHPASRYAIVGVFVAKTGDGVRVAVTGAGTCVFRQGDMEAALAKDFSASAIEGIEVSQDGLNTDLFASPEYRAHLVGVMARRAVEAASG